MRYYTVHDETKALKRNMYTVQLIIISVNQNSLIYSLKTMHNHKIGNNNK